MLWDTCEMNQLNDLNITEKVIQGANFQQDGFTLVEKIFQAEAFDKVLLNLKRVQEDRDLVLLRHPNGKLEKHELKSDDQGNFFIVNQLLNPHRENQDENLAEALLTMICTEELGALLQDLSGGYSSFSIKQTILFFTSPRTSTHIDGWFFDTEPRGKSFTLWIPFEHVTRESGAVGVYPTPAGQVEYELLDEALKFDNAYEHFHEKLMEKLSKKTSVIPSLRPHDLLIFSSTTPHFSSITKKPLQSRIGMQLLVKPSSLPEQTYFGKPLQSEQRKVNNRWAVMY